MFVTDCIIIFVLIFHVTVFSVNYTLERIRRIIKTNKINLFKMIMNTSVINQDANFIHTKQEIIQKTLYNSHNYHHPSNRALIEQAFECDAWDILFYLLSFNDIILHPIYIANNNINDEVNKYHKYPYTGNANKYVQLWIQQTSNTTTFKIKYKLLERLINHENFDHNHFIQSVGQTVLQYALTHTSYIKKSNYKEYSTDSGNGRRQQTIDLVLKSANWDQSINHVDYQQGVTALHIAASAMDVETVDKLLKFTNIDCDIKDNQGNTPFMLACQLPKPDNNRSLPCEDLTTQMKIHQDLQSAMVELFLAADGCDVLSTKESQKVYDRYLHN